MPEFLERIRRLVQSGEVRVSEHGYEEIAEDDISVQEILDGVITGVAVESYPDFPKGHCVLVLQSDREGQPVHVVWGIPAGFSKPAVVVTAYRPDPRKWSDDFRERRR